MADGDRFIDKALGKSGGDDNVQYPNELRAPGSDRGDVESGLSPGSSSRFIDKALGGGSREPGGLPESYRSGERATGYDSASSYAYRPDLSFTTEEPEGGAPLTTMKDVAIRQQHLRKLGNYVQDQIVGKDLPPTYDQVSQVIEGISFLETDVLRHRRFDQQFLNSLDVFVTPELIQLLATELATAQEETRIAYEKAYAEDPGMAMFAFGSATQIAESLVADIGTEKYEPGLELQQNVAVLMDAPQLNEHVKDATWSLLSSLPTNEIQLSAEDLARVTEDENLKFINEQSAKSSALAIVPDINIAMVRERQEQTQGSRYRNYREELAGEAYYYLENNPLKTAEDERKFLLWMWQNAEMKQSEIAGQESHIGQFGELLDLGKFAMTHVANDFIQQVDRNLNAAFPETFKAPNDAINHSHISFGKNIAMMFDYAPGDSGSWADSGLGAFIATNLEAGPLAWTPVGAGITGYRGLKNVFGNPTYLIDRDPDSERFGQHILKDPNGDPDDPANWKASILPGTTGWSPFVANLRQNASTYDWISGTMDLASWIYLDPLNYAVNVGFGAKAAKTVPLAANISRGRQMMRALIPVYGKYATSVFNAPTARLTHAILAKTAKQLTDEMFNTRRGRQLWDIAVAAENSAELMRKTQGMNAPMAEVLWGLAQRGDREVFKQQIYVGMSGGLDELAVIDSPLRVALDREDEAYHVAVQAGLDDGRVGIRDAMEGAAGVSRVDHPHPFEIVEVPNPAAVAASVESGVATTRKARDAGRLLARAPESGLVTLRDGTTATVRRLGDDVALYDDAGNWLGGFTEGGRRFAVDEAARRRGVGDALYEYGVQQGIDVSGNAFASGGVTQDMVRFLEAKGVEVPAELRTKAFGTDGPQTILRQSQTEYDGTRKAVLNVKRGFDTIRPSNPSLQKWLIGQGHTNLAARLQTAADEALTEASEVSLFDFRISMLSAEEQQIIRSYLDNVSDAHAFGHADELLLGSRADGKLLIGNDIETPTSLYDALPKESYRQMLNYKQRQVATGGHSQMTLINQMPRPKMSATWGKSVADMLPISSTGKQARFWRKLRFGTYVPAPAGIDIANASLGRIDLERELQLLGASPQLRDEWLSRWDLATTQQERYTVKLQAERAVGAEVNYPIMEMGMINHTNLHGDVAYGADAAGVEIGRAKDLETGIVSVVPTLPTFRQNIVPVVDLGTLNRMIGRYQKSKRLPKGIVNGFGKTSRRREDLATAYRREINLVGTETQKALTDDQLLEMAYSDVLGWGSRENGLGKLSRAMKVAGSAYSFGMGFFQIAQLAFRPLPWAGRVLLEENVRSWMMGMPSFYRNQVHYALTSYDAHWFRIRENKLRHQRRMAQASSNDIFSAGRTNLDDAIEEANKIIPGFAEKAAKSEIVDRHGLRLLYEHELSKSLTGMATGLDIESRGNMSMRTIFRKNRIVKTDARIQEATGIKPGFDWAADVPEIINKSNVWLLSEEMQSSIKPLTWSERLRRQDIPAYADSWFKKAQQVLGDRNGNYALQRMADKAQNIEGTYTASSFRRTKGWQEMRGEIANVARERGKNVDDINGVEYLDDLALAEWYLDTIVEDDWILTLLKPLWGEDMDEKARILRELANGKQTKVTVDGIEFDLDLRPNTHVDNRAGNRRFFEKQYDVGNFAFPEVAGYLHPLYGQSTLPGIAAYPRKMTNWILQTFGETASQKLHRQPAYIFQRKMWYQQMKRLGWDDADAAHLAHQKAFEMVNYTYFNNQHTGHIVARMNKAIPFFSAQMEVLSTWAWKIPRMNYLPLGYARMLHQMDKVMQGFVKLGLVDINDEGQWSILLDDDANTVNPFGNALSKGMKEWVQSPVTLIEQIANTYRLVAQGSDYEPIDFSAWKGDFYKLPIGSPVMLGSHGVMGVNQIEMGPGPGINLAATAGLNLIKRLPFAADRELIEGKTLAEAYDQLPDDVSTAEFVEINQRVLREHLTPEQYNLLWREDGYFANPEAIDIEGLPLQVPGSSLFDTWLYESFEQVVFPYGHIETPQGLIRSLQPAGISYMLRGLTGIHADENELPDGLLSMIMGPMEDYQIKSQIAKSILHLEGSEGLITLASDLSEELRSTYMAAGFGSVEEFKAKYDLGSETGQQFIEVEERLRDLNDEILKRATDNAGMSVFMRGVMGFLLPATPKMFREEEKTAGMFWGSKEVAEAARLRGSVRWGDMMAALDVRTEEDMEMAMGLVSTWLNDDSGGKTKQWFREQYPDLEAWLNPTTFWGPQGPSPESQNFDGWYDDLERGRTTPIPPDVLMQKVARAAVANGHEAALVTTFGNDYKEQGQQILYRFDEYLDLVDKNRQKRFALDMWDDSLNGSAYDEWRKMNDNAQPVVYERVLDELYNMRATVDEILSLVDHADLDPGDQKTINMTLRRITSEYIRATNEILDELRADDEFRNPREELISRYFAEISGPYYQELQPIYDKLDTAETSEEESVIFEEAKLVKNKMFTDQHFLEVEGEKLLVPNELERAWTVREEKDKTYQVMQWTTRPVEWLDLFSANKVVENFPDAEQYIPTTAAQMAPYDEAARGRLEIYEYTRRNPEDFSVHDRTQAVNQWEEWLKSTLAKQGRHSEVQWLDAWPIEKLGLTGQLPEALREVAEYYVGIKNELAAIDGGKGPTSQEGRIRFNSLFYILTEQYFPGNEAARRAFEELGSYVFGTGTTATTMARLYGEFRGEVS